MHYAPITLALVVGLAGCGGAATDDDSTPAPSPVVVSPSPASSPSPAVDMDGLYIDAEKVVRNWTEIQTGYRASVEETKFPAEANELLGEPYLELVQIELAMEKDLGMRLEPDAEVPLVAQPAPEMQLEDAEVTLRVCEDASNAPFVDAAGEEVSPGEVTVLLYHFKQFDGQLKIFNRTDQETVAECPFA
ncbi:MAG: hypothetical protein ACOX61_08380 [Brooklawnia sp.]|jgi:hypothetical protein